MNGEDNVREGGQGPYRGIGVYMILTRINFRKKRGVYQLMAGSLGYMGILGVYLQTSGKYI